MIEVIAAWLVDVVEKLGYPGIFIMAFLESTFVPIPAEVTMVPAGYLVYKGNMHFWPVLFLSIAGCVCGSYLNYWIAQHYGRRFLRAYGKYMFVKPERLEALERYFASHGEISILTGRLIPGLRHFISFPAGLARMDLRKFSLYTGIGGGVWMLVMISVGYLIGDNKALVKHYMHFITYFTLGLVVLTVLFYVYNHRKKNKGGVI